MSIKPNFDSYEENFKAYTPQITGFSFNDSYKINSHQRELHTQVITIPQDLLKASRETYSGDHLGYEAKDLYSSPFIEVSQGCTESGTPKWGGEGSADKEAEMKDPPLRNLNYACDNATGYKQPEIMMIDTNVVKAKSLPAAPPRSGLFSTIPIDRIPSLQTPSKSARASFEERGLKFMFNVSELTFDSGNVEPFQIGFFIFDCETQVKLSETFIMSTSPEFMSEGDPTSFIVRVQQLRPTVCLGITIFHRFNEDYDDAIIPYFKTPTGKHFTKWESGLKEVTTKYIQYFGYAAQPIFTKDGGTLLSGDFTVEIIKVKDDFYSFAYKYILGGEKERSKLKCIPGRIKMFVKNLENERLDGRYNVYNPSLYPVTQAKMGPVVRELTEFYIAEDVVAPYTEYVNTLYIYPESINLTNYKGADCGVKNVLVGLKILSNDDSATEKGLCTAYPFRPNHGLTEEVFLPVQYRQKKLKFLLGEEVKFEIPSALSKSHNLVVTLYNIDTKKKKHKTGDGESAPEVLGHCILPLLKDEWMVTDGRYSIPMLYQPPQRYLSGLESADNKEYKWVDGKKLTFNFKLRIVSSVYPGDGTISRFLRTGLSDLAKSRPLGTVDPDSKLSPDQKMAKIVRKLSKANGYLLTMHFHAIMNKLLVLVREDTSPLGRSTFCEMLGVLDKVAKDTARKLYAQPVLESYADILYTPPELVSGAKTVHEAIFCRIAEALDPASTVEKLREAAPQVAEYAWFLYGVAYKDMILDLYARKMLLRNGVRKTRFAEPIVNYIRKGVAGMASFVAAQSDPRVCFEGNNAAAYFLRNMLNVLDRGVVFGMIYSYVETLNTEGKATGTSYDNVQTCKFNFLRILAAHDQYVQLLMPKSDRLESLETFDLTMFQDHFLSQLLIREVSAALTRKGATRTRQMALEVVLELLHRHELDPMLEMPMAKTFVMNAYFPLVITLNNTLPDIFPFEERTESSKVAANSDDIEGMGSPKEPPKEDSSLPTPSLEGSDIECKMWLVCMLEIVKYTGDLMRCWLPKEKPRNIANFFKQLSRAAEFFRYPGVENCKPYKCEFLNAATATALSALKSPLGPVGSTSPALPGLVGGGVGGGGIGGGIGSSGTIRGDGGASMDLAYLNLMENEHAVMMDDRVLSRKEVRSVVLGKATTIRSQNLSYSAAALSTSTGNLSGSIGNSGGSGVLSSSARFSGEPGGGDDEDGGGSTTEACIFAPELLERPKTVGMRALISSAAARPERWAWVVKNAKGSKLDFVLMAKNGLMEVSHITLNCCLDYLNDCYDLVIRAQQQQQQQLRQQQQQQQNVRGGELTEIGEATLPAALGVISTLLKCEQCQEFMPLLIFAASLTIKRYRTSLFIHSANVFKELTCNVIRLIESPCPEFRQMALGILCEMLACNQVVAKNISLTKLQCTIVLSQLVGDKAKLRYTEAGFRAIAEYFVRGPFASETNDLYAKVRDIVQNAAVLDKYSNNREVIGSLYYSLSNGFLDSPDLRLAWLDNLAKLHLENENLEECAKTRTLMAALALKYCTVVRPAAFRIDVPDSAWESVLPNFRALAKMPSEKILWDLRNEICTSRYFTPNGFEELLTEAIGNLSSVSNYEQCIETRKILLTLYTAMHDFASQTSSYLDLYNLCQKTADEIKIPTRVPPNYYRVAFYGASFGEKENGKQFIYKEPPFVRIADFTDRIKEQFQSKGIRLEILPNSKEVVPGKLSLSKSYIQIGAVTILENDGATEDIDRALSENEISATEAKKLKKKYQKTLFEQHFGVDSFVMEMPFMKSSSKAQGDIKGQWKRKITFVTDGAFPTVEKRLMVKGVRSEEIPPIENAISLINDKNRALEAELSSAKPDTRTLQIILNGSLLAFVNAGPLEICKVFLGQDVNTLDPVPTEIQIDKLKETMKHFSKSLSFALKLNKRLIKEDQEELQKELELAYDDFSKKIIEYCSPK